MFPLVFERLLGHFLKGIFQFDFQAVNSGKFDCDDNELFGKSCKCRRKALLFQLYLEENENLTRYSMITAAINVKDYFH